MESKLDQVIAALATLQQGETMAQATLDDILNEARREATVAASVKALLEQLYAMRNDPAKLQATFDQLIANSQVVGDAITANTPAAA